MKDIIFIVESGIHRKDGYKTRIEMEIGILKPYYNCYILMPCGKGETIPEFMHKVNVIKYNSYGEKVPYILNWYKLNRALNLFLDSHPNTIIVGEAHTSAIMSYRTAGKRNCRFIFDCHGTGTDEVYMCNHNIIGFLYSKWMKRREKRLLNYSDLIITVSNYQYKHWGINKKYVLLPMLPTEIFFDNKKYRETIRKSLNIPIDKIVYLYSGQNQVWQQIDKTLQYYKRIETDNTMLVIYTHDLKEIEDMVKINQIKSYVIQTIQYKQMPMYLDVADFGFCIRDDSIINKVSSPTKILEYLARNVKPIITQHVGDFSLDLPKLKLAYLIDKSNEDFPGRLVKNEGQEYAKKYKENRTREFLREVGKLC